MTEQEFNHYMTKIPHPYANMTIALEEGEDILGTILMAAFAEIVMLHEEVDALRKSHELIMQDWAK